MEEDTVRYTIYPTSFSTSSASATSATGKSDLDSLLQRCLSAALPHASAYLWHRDSFCLRADEARGCLAGEVRYGNNAEDEWFVVALLARVTREVDGAVARVEDAADGELLLIEAADHLPRWAQEPEAAGGRAFLCRGRMHLVPLADRPSLLSPFPSALAEEGPDPRMCAQVVADPAFHTEASEEIQAAIQSRLGGRPSDWKDNLHYVHALLPAKAALLLHQSPQLISAVVHRLLDMDREDAKILRSFRSFGRSGSFRTGVEMTKCLYAMLESRDLYPAKGSGWTVRKKEEGEEGDRGWKEEALGFKISAGMELLLADVERTGAEEGGGSAAAEKAFLGKLEQLGYFRDLLPGSKEHRELLRGARCAFSAGGSDGAARREDARLAEFRECFLKAGDFAEEEEAARPERLRRPADDDAWLRHDQASLDRMLKRHFRVAERDEPAVMEKLADFLDSESDMRGVEVVGVEEDVDRPLEINMDDFDRSMKKVMEALEVKEVDSDSEESDGGGGGGDEADQLMEEELLSSNVKDGDELLRAIKNLTEGIGESSTHPSKTLLQTVRK